MPIVHVAPCTIFLAVYIPYLNNLSRTLAFLSLHSIKGEERAAALLEILHLRLESCRGIFGIFLLFKVYCRLDISRWCGTWGCWSSPTLQKPPPSRTSKIPGLFSRPRMVKAGEEDFGDNSLNNFVWRFEDYLRGWMKGIGDLLNESEQLRVETDDCGPQVFSKF